MPEKIPISFDTGLKKKGHVFFNYTGLTRSSMWRWFNT